MATKTVIFDVGNTLIVPKPSVPEEMCLLAKELGYEIELDIAKDAYRRAEEKYDILSGADNSFWADSAKCEQQWRDEYRLAFELCDVTDGIDELVDRIFAHYLDGDGWELLDDAHELLAELLDRDMECAVVSNWDDHLPEILEDLGLAVCFNEIVTSADAKSYKPLPGIFERCMQKLEALPEYCLYIGDVPDIDGVGASSAGIPVVIIDRHDKHPDSVYPRIHDLTEVLELL